MHRHGPASTVLWGLVVLCWAWIFAASRARNRLLNKLGNRFGGFVHTRFSWATFTPEARQLSFVRMYGKTPCQFRLRYVFPLGGMGVPLTVMEFELPESLLGNEPGGYLPEEWHGGRGLFLAGVNLTPVYAKFIGELPRGVRPRLGWLGSEVRISLPGLLGDAEEIWVTRCFEFLDELAGRLCGAGPR